MVRIGWPIPILQWVILKQATTQYHLLDVCWMHLPSRLNQCRSCIPPLVQQCWESVQNQNLSRLTHNTSFWLSYPCLGSITLTQTHFRSFWPQKHQPSHGLAFCQAATTRKMGSVWMSTSESFHDASIPNQMEFKAIASDDQLGWAWPQEG